MLRSDLINEVLSLFVDPNYLEVGVWRGDTFLAVSARSKVGVDPSFQFDTQPVHASLLFEMASNEYFATKATIAEKFDVVFLDGLHTYEQTLTDLLHAVDRIKEHGVLIIDDVLPDSYPASMRSEADCLRFRQALNDPGTHWMGDVFKLVFFIDTFMLGWSYCTVAETHGQVVMWREPRLSGSVVSETAEEVANKTYSDTVMHRDRYAIKPLSDILISLKERIGPSTPGVAFAAASALT